MGSKSQPENKRLQFAFSYFFFHGKISRAFEYTLLHLYKLLSDQGPTTKISKFDLHTFLNCKGFCRNPCSVNLPIRGQTLNFGLISKFRFKKTDWTFGIKVLSFDFEPSKNYCQMNLIFIFTQNIECLQFEYLFTEMEEVCF